MAHLTNRAKDSFYHYAIGRWRLHKTFRYRTGGTDATFEGQATFLPLVPEEDQGIPWSLLLQEEGTIHLGTTSLPAHKNLLFRCGGPVVQVYFVDGLAPLKVGGFFHQLAFQKDPLSGGQVHFEHLCIKDLYKGTLCIVGQDEFHWSWSITGPAKDGAIWQTFVREKHSKLFL